MALSLATARLWVLRNPANAAPGTIRKECALSVGENSVHGSDAAETAAVEIAQFFSAMKLLAEYFNKWLR